MIKERIEEIKAAKDADIPKWEQLVNQYDKSKHDVHTGIKFSGVSPKNLIKVDWAGQKLMCDRMVQMMNTIPIERVYEAEGEAQEVAKNIIEAVYKDNKIDAENNKRLHAYFASCEVATMVVGIEEEHNRYGVPCKTRIKFVSTSPMERKYSSLNQGELYPVFDEYGGMLGMGIGGQLSDESEFFNYYTKTTIEEYIKPKNGSWHGEARENEVGKIPFSYLYRMAPIYDGQENNIDVIETIESSQGQVVKRNAAPLLEVKGEIGQNFANIEKEELERKSGVPREVWNVDGDGGIRFVDTPINADAPDRLINRIKALIEEESQLPLNLNLETLKGLGNVSGETLKQVLMGAHLKVGQEKHAVIEFLDREMRIVKEYLALALPKYAEAIHAVKVEHKVTPFTMNDETEDLNRNISRLNNNLTSRQEIMRNEGIKNPERILEEVNAENADIAAAVNFAGANPYDFLDE